MEYVLAERADRLYGKNKCSKKKKCKRQPSALLRSAPKRNREKEARLASHSFGGTGPVIRNVRYGVCGWQAAGSRHSGRISRREFQY